MSNINSYANPSNDYIIPDLQPCSGISDSYTFEFLGRERIGISDGTNTIIALDFSDIKIPVTTWNQESKIINPGEVIYIPGLTKGLQNREQGFSITYTPYSTALDKYFLQVDLSINYYSGFRYTTNAVCASANYHTGIDIDDALNIALSNKSIGVTSTYDPSSLTFSGDIPGYDYEITNVVLTLIDASLDSSSNIPATIINGARVPMVYNLSEDSSLNIPYAMYPNGASKGIFLKALYSTENPDLSKDWIYFNHAKSPQLFFDPITISTVISDISTNIGLSYDISTLIDLGFVKYTINASIYSYEWVSNLDLSNEIIYRGGFEDCSISDSSINGSAFNGCNLITNENINNIWTGVVGDPSLNLYQWDSSTLRTTITGLSNIWDSSLNNATINDCSLFRCNIQDSSLINCTVYNTYLTGVSKTNTIIYDIDSSLWGNVSYTINSSTYYTRNLKSVNVGMNGLSSATVVSAGDYLDYITTNDQWNKLSKIYAISGAIDSSSYQSKNLINGLYLYNPQAYSVQVDYIQFL